MADPEELARQEIDALLGRCGWTVQDKNAVNLSASRGVAVLKAACEGKLVPTEAELARERQKAKVAEASRLCSSDETRRRDASATISDAEENAGAENQSRDRSATQEDLGYETGAQLLERILSERRNKWSGKGTYKEPVKPDTANLPPLPDGWAVASSDQLSWHITSGSRDWSQYYGKGKGIFILAQNVRPLRLDFTECQLVDAPHGDPETERTRVTVNDLLVTIVGAKTGDVCRVSRNLTNHYVCQSVALIRLVDPLCSRFAELYLASLENGQAQWKRYIYGQGRPHLSFEQLRMTAVLLPPLVEQQRIVAEVERRLSVVEELEAVVNANL